MTNEERAVIEAAVAVCKVRLRLDRDAYTSLGWSAVWATIRTLEEAVDALPQTTEITT
jgi:hypothetical protein